MKKISKSAKCADLEILKLYTIEILFVPLIAAWMEIIRVGKRTDRGEKC